SVERFPVSFARQRRSKVIHQRHDFTPRQGRRNNAYPTTKKTECRQAFRHFASLGLQGEPHFDNVKYGRRIIREPVPMTAAANSMLDRAEGLRRAGGDPALCREL